VNREQAETRLPQISLTRQTKSFAFQLSLAMDLNGLR
jgi:hypothetical protein